MADHLPRRVSVQAAIAAGLLVAGLLLIARPSSQSAVVTTQFETVAHSKLSKYEVEDFTTTTFVSGPSNTFLPPSCNYSLNISAVSDPTAPTAVKGLCQIANTNTRCCTYNPIPADTAGCTTACAQRYISFFCYSACNTQFPGNQTCSQPIIDLYNACTNQASCKVLGAGNGQGAAFWAAANGITLSSPSNTNCTSNFTAVDVVPCGQSSVPTFQSNLPIIAHFTTSDANVPEFVYPGEFTSSNPLQISSAERFGVLFNVNNHGVSGACSATTPPVKALITVTLTPASSTTPILLGNFTLYSPWFRQNGTFFEADTAKNEPETDLVQLDPTEGDGLVTITVVVYNFQGASAANSTSFYIHGITPTSQNSLILPNGQTYSPNTQSGNVVLSNLTLLGDNTIDGRGGSNTLLVGQITFPDNTTTQDSVTFKNVIVTATNITFGSGGLSNAIYLINSTLTIAGSTNSKYETSFDSAQLCICGDSSSKVIFGSQSVFNIVTGNSQGSNGNNNLVFCGQLTAIIQRGAVVQVTQTAFNAVGNPATEGIGVIDGASLINSGTINLNDGVLVIYTTGQFINNGTITALNSTQTGIFTGTNNNVLPYTSIFLISGNFNETVNGESIGVNRTSGPAPTATFLQPWTTCEPGLTIIRVTTIQLCGTNSTNVTVGSGVVAVVGNEDTCDVGATFNGTEIVAEVYNLEVLNGGEVEFDNINGNDGLLVVLGAAHWQTGSNVKVDLDSSVNAEQVFIPLMVCVNTADPLQCCSPPPNLVSSQQNGITQTIVCLSFGQPGYPFNNTAHKFGTKGVANPATMGVVLSQTVQAAPSQVNTPRYVSGNTYCVELNENPSQFPQSTFLAYVSNTLGIAQNLVNIIVYGTDAATGYLKVQFSCRDFYSAANADNTCTNIYNQALGTGTFNSQVQGIQQCGIATNAPPSKDHSNNALFALFALAAIPLLICFCVIILCLNKKRQADNQYMQDTATFSNVASSPQNVAYAAPSDKYYPSYPTPTPIGYYP